MASISLHVGKILYVTCGRVVEVQERDHVQDCRRLILPAPGLFVSLSGLTMQELNVSGCINRPVDFIVDEFYLVL